MSETQYLVDCFIDSSFCLIHEKSILCDGKWKRLHIGDVVKFYYPEDEIDQIEYDEKFGLCQVS